MVSKKKAGGPATDPTGRMKQVSELQYLILGNAQSGKSTVFQQLAGERPGSLPLPGASDRLARAPLKSRFSQRLRGAFAEDPVSRILLDSPGTATLFPQGEDEVAAHEALLYLRPDALILVADARNLRRSLALFLHAAQYAVPMVVALNFVDEARLHGIEIDTDALEEQLGVPVVPMVAIDGIGVGELLRRLDDARTPEAIELPAPVAATVAQLEQHLISLPAQRRGVALSLIAASGSAEALVLRETGRVIYGRCREALDALASEGQRTSEVMVTESLYAAAEAVADRVSTRSRLQVTALDRFASLSQHPLWGTIMALLVVVGLYYFVGVLGATIVVDWFNETIFEQGLIPVSELLLGWIPISLVREALLDPDFGLLPTGLFLALGLVFPVLLFFYLAFGVLQDSGYMARLSVLMDRHMRRIGLNGRGLVPLAMGFSCVTMALITTRMLESKRERIIASFLMMLAIPCAPLLGVILVVLGDLPASATAVVFVLIALQLLLAGHVASRLLPGRSGDFIMELPPMRIPRLRHVLWMTWRQTYLFMREAVPYFLLATLALFVFDRIGGLDATKVLLSPGFEALLGLPEETIQVFIKTFIRRENGAAELERLKDHFTPLQMVVTILLMTFVAPCINAVLVLYKERGAVAATAITLTVTAYALVLGAAVNHACQLLGVTFGG